MTQIIVNILFSASSIFLVALSFSIIFSTAKFFHFAHAAVITAGAYVYLISSKWLGVPFLGSVLLALFLGSVLGWCLEIFIYRYMRQHGSSPLILLLASLGLYIVLQNVVSAVFGDDTKIIGAVEITPTVSIFGAILTNIQLTAICASVFTLVGKVIFVDKTRIGLSLRAVADSPELARVSGIEFNRTMGIAFCLGSFLASAAGIFQAFDVGMTPTMGLPMLLLGVVAVVLGGNGKTLGVAIASLLLAFCQQIAAWMLGTQWEETVAFFVLLVFLMVRPQGVLGRSSRQSAA